MDKFIFDAEPQNSLESFMLLANELLEGKNSIEFRNLYWEDKPKDDPDDHGKYIKENVYCKLENVSPKKYQLTAQYTQALLEEDNEEFKQYYGGPYITQVVVSQSEGIESIKYVQPTYVFFKDNVREDNVPVFANPADLNFFNWSTTNPYIQVYQGSELLSDTISHEQLVRMIQGDIKNFMRHIEEVIYNRKTS